MEAAGSPAASVLRVLETVPEQATLLVTTADHPLLNVDMVNAFFAGLEAEPAEAFGALTDVKAIRALYPEMRRTALRFRDEACAGCNLFAFRRTAAPLVRFFQQLEDHRKQPFRLARHLGYGTLLRYLMGRLTLDDAVSQLERKTGVRCRSSDWMIPTPALTWTALTICKRCAPLLVRPDCSSPRLPPRRRRPHNGGA